MKNKIIILSVLVLTFTLCLFTTNKLKNTSASEVEQVSNDYSDYTGSAIDWNSTIENIYVNKKIDYFKLFQVCETFSFIPNPLNTEEVIYPIYSNADFSCALIILKSIYSISGYEDNHIRYDFIYSNNDTIHYILELNYIPVGYFDADDDRPYFDYTTSFFDDFISINNFNYAGNILSAYGFTLENKNNELSSLLSTTPFQLNGASGGASDEELQNAYNNGLDDGYESGLEDGYDVGFNAGSDKGYQSGLTDGYNNGLDDGYDNGYDVGFSDGTAESQVQLDYLQNEVHKLETQNSQLEQEKIEEYNKGYNDSAEDNQSFKDMVFSIIEAPFKVIKEALNFEIFGINISGLVLFLITGALIIFILKIFL